MISHCQEQRAANSPPENARGDVCFNPAPGDINPLANTIHSRRFTRDGSPELERQLQAICDRVSASVRSQIPGWLLDGLLLGGGYGRGEGGVLREPAGDRPYNDLEFYVFVHGHPLLAERLLGSRLHHRAEELSKAAGVEVEFKILTNAKLRRSPANMFYYDLVVGHRQLIGTETLLAGCEHHCDAAAIPLSEATRLLMNRCSGLLFAADLLKRPGFGAAERDFVGRNLAKAELALGDVWLAAHRQYHWSCLERRRRLTEFTGADLPGWFRAVSIHHASGVEFKLHPVRCADDRETLSARHSKICALAQELWLWLESKRLGRSFASVCEYATSPTNKCPETLSWKNRLLHGRQFGLRSALTLAGSRYPRERLLHALALLLFEPAAATIRRDRLQLVQAALQTRAATFTELVESYRRIWSRFN